jgi:TldD protein
MLDKNLIGEVLSIALQNGADFSEIYLEDKFSTSITLNNNDIDKAVSGRTYGVGIRVFLGTNAVYAYTNDTRRDTLFKTAIAAAKALKNPKHNDPISINFENRNVKNRHYINLYPRDVERKRKLDLMKMTYDAAKNYDSLISDVSVSYLEWDQNVLIANSTGVFAEDRRIRTRLAITSIAGEKKQTGFFGPGASAGFDYWERNDPTWYAREASRIAKTMSQAEYAPAGKMPVIISNGFGGVIFHEACGHQLEATSVAKGISVFADKLGQQIASEAVNAYDDGTLTGEWGSDTVDDEGTPMQKNALIEKGVLKGFMVDKLGGRRMNMRVTGNSRRQSYEVAPTSRMTNTYIGNGPYIPEQIISETEYGLYAKSMGGGSVDPATGEFNFAVNEGYLIKKGKIDKPVRGATLIGRGSEILNKIDMVGNDLKHGQGMCGSVSGSVPVNVGQPTLRVSEILVGGRENNEH